MSTDQRHRLGESLHRKYFLEPPRKGEDKNRGLGRRLQGCVTTTASWMKPRVSTPIEKKGFPGDSGVKNLPANAAEQEMATHSNISCPGNPTDRGAWWIIVHGEAKGSDMALVTKQQQTGPANKEGLWQKEVTVRAISAGSWRTKPDIE